MKTSDRKEKPSAFGKTSNMRQKINIEPKAEDLKEMEDAYKNKEEIKKGFSQRRYNATVKREDW